MTNTYWERIQIVMAFTGCKTVSSFARAIGHKGPATLYRIKNDGAHISLKLAKTINRHFSLFPVEWIHSGTGDFKVMITGSEQTFTEFKNALIFLSPSLKPLVPGQYYLAEFYGIKKIIQLKKSDGAQIEFYTSDNRYYSSIILHYHQIKITYKVDVYLTATTPNHKH